MWPTSEITVLLWGDAWWVPGRAEPLPFQNTVHAAEVLVAEMPGVRRVRLIFQPDALRSVAVECPRGNRDTLRGILGHDYPVLCEEAHAWGFEPIFGLGEGYGTILHYEETPGLFALVEALAAKGVTVVSAWPLLTFLHAVPGEWSESGGMTVAAVSAERALVYHHPAGGPRSHLAWQGPAAVIEAKAWIAEKRAKAPEEPLLLIVAGECDGPEGVESRSLGEAVAHPVVLAAGHPAQLLPPVAVFSAQRAVVAASVLILLAGGWSAVDYLQQYRASARLAQDSVIEKSKLVAEIEHFRVNRTEILSLRARLAEADTLPLAEWLDAMTTTVPPAVALDSLKVVQGRFRVAGHHAPGEEAAFERWSSQVRNARWQIAAVKRSADGAFALEGTFLP